MAANATREGEFLEEVAHALLVFALVRIDFRVGAFQVDRSQHAGRTMTRAGHEDGVEIVLVDQPVHVHVAEGQAGAGAPVAEQTILDVLDLQRFLQERIVLQVDHAGGEIAAGMPIGIDEFQFILGDGRRSMCQVVQDYLLSRT